MRERLGLLDRHRYLRLQLVDKIVNDYHCPRQLQGYFLLRSELRRKALRHSKGVEVITRRHRRIILSETVFTIIIIIYIFYVISTFSSLYFYEMVHGSLQFLLNSSKVVKEYDRAQ